MVPHTALASFSRHKSRRSNARRSRDETPTTLRCTHDSYFYARYATTRLVLRGEGALCKNKIQDGSQRFGRASMPVIAPEARGGLPLSKVTEDGRKSLRGSARAGSSLISTGVPTATPPPRADGVPGVRVPTFSTARRVSSMRASGVMSPRERYALVPDVKGSTLALWVFGVCFRAGAGKDSADPPTLTAGSVPIDADMRIVP